MQTLSKIKIKGFKSIESAELTLGDINVVIGANGSGKSNLIGIFRLLERVLSKNLQLFVASEPDRLLYHGRKQTSVLSLDFEFQEDSYDFALQVDKDTLIFKEENVTYKSEIGNRATIHLAIGSGHKESNFEDVTKKHLAAKLARQADMLIQAQFPEYFFSKANSLIVHHFHDTSETSPAKQSCDISDNRLFRRDAANLPAYLYWMQEKHPVHFRHIEEHIRLVAPFFDHFVLAPSRLNENRIKLEWRQKGSDAYFDAYSLSDGTLRFICLATLLLQPEPPALILLDEPELGLHPFAIRLLAEMLESASANAQVLLATQSVTLLNNFALKDVIVAENDGIKTTFHRLEEQQLKHWLDEFSLGELWEKNVLGGWP